MRMTRRHFLAAAGAGTLALLAPAVRAGEARPISGTAFGGRWHAVVPPGTAEPEVRAMLGAIVGQIDALFSPYRRDSVLTRLNGHGGNDWQPVPLEFAGLARAAQALHEDSDGSFDPAVGPIVNRFGYGPITGRVAPFGALEVGETALRKTDPSLTLDLCGIAKGHALDRIVAALGAAGHGNVLLELGGEMRTLGTHPDGRDWQVGIEDPRPGAARVHGVIAPRGRAVATSGHAAQGAAGVTHLIDPRRGRPADMRLLSVTVLAGTAQAADGLATTLAVLGPEDGPAWAEAKGIAALFLLADGPGLRPITTGDFADHILA